MRTRLMLLVLLMVVVLIGCQQDAWKEFSSREGAFSILFPGTPIETIQQANTVADGIINVHIFSFEQKGSSYFVLYSDYPESVFKRKDANKILDDMRDSFVSKGKLISEDIVSLDEYPGRDLRIKTLDGKYNMNDCIYLVKNRAYQIMTMTEKDAGFSEEDLIKFLESFKILEG